MQQKKIYALGFFDGVHLGHQALLKACRDLADSAGLQAAAITFDAHPQSLLTQDAPKLINTTADRVTLLKAFGMDSVRVLPVTGDVLSTPWERFLAQLLEENAVGFVCGRDFRFGHRGEGTAQKLSAWCQAKGLSCHIVDDRCLDGIRISSSHIRSLLESGDLERANRFLGHAHILTGEVVSGRGLGRTIGIPTANLHIPSTVTTPAHGVYACLAETEGQNYMAVTNIGSRPTVGGHRITVEPWLLDLSGDLYGKPLTLRFEKFLRPEQKFDSLEELTAEIRKNAAQTREFFQKT